MGVLAKVKVAQIRSDEHAQRFALNDEALDDLCRSIERLGLLNPLVVCRSGDGYDLLGGHRRLACLKRLSWSECDCLVLEAGEKSPEEVTFAENFFRVDLSAVELAVAMARELESGRLTVDQLAAGFHRSGDWVRRYVAMTEWPDNVLEAVHSGGLSMSAAANLALVEENEYREFLVRQAVENGATARATSAWLQAWRCLLPAEKAVTLPGGPDSGVSAPLIPQAPCFGCGTVVRTDALSHIPLCGACAQRVRGPL